MKLLIELPKNYILELQDVTKLNMMDNLTFCYIINEPPIYPILHQMVKDGILSNFEIQEDNIKLSIRTKYVKDILEDEEECDCEECPFKQEAKQVWMELVEDVFEYGFFDEFAKFMVENPDLDVFEIDEQFRKEWDI